MDELIDVEIEVESARHNKILPVLEDVQIDLS